MDALARTAQSEVGHFGKYGDQVLKGGIEAVVDTIINRVAHPSYPKTIDGVVNQRFQFSAIGGPGGSGTWDRLKPAGAAIARVVQVHVGERVRGKSCSVRGATHFLNPHLSSKNSLTRWGNHVVRTAIAVWGDEAKKDVHYHGFAPGATPPPDYALQFEGASCEFSGAGVAKSAMAAAEGVPAASGVRDHGVEESEPAMATEVLDGQAPIYKVTRIAPEALPQLQDVLNGFAEEGWRLRQIVPDKKDLLLVLEGLRLADTDTEVDESIGAGVVDSLSEMMASGASAAALSSIVAPAADGGQFDMAAFSQMFEALKLKHFKAHEFLVLGNQHFSGACKGKNTLPPRELWMNIQPTALVLDALREKLNAPIRTLSVYRSPSYNACIPGAAGGSVHKRFMAVDFKCEDGKGPLHWAKALKEFRDAGLFKGGIGVYRSFVHVDTRGTNANFGPLVNKVF